MYTQAQNLNPKDFLSSKKLSPAYKPPENEQEYLKKMLSSSKSKYRKIASMVILNVCYNNTSFIDKFRELRMIQCIENYAGISLNNDLKLEEGKEFLRKLKKDPLFMKRDIKSNKFF